MGFDALGRVRNWCHGDRLKVRLLPRSGLSAAMPSVSWGPDGRDFRGTADDVLGVLGTPTLFGPGLWKYGESAVRFDAAGNVVGVENKGEFRFATRDGRGFLVGSSLSKR